MPSLILVNEGRLLTSGVAYALSAVSVFNNFKLVFDYIPRK